MNKLSIEQPRIEPGSGNIPCVVCCDRRKVDTGGYSSFFRNAKTIGIFEIFSAGILFFVFASVLSSSIGFLLGYPVTVYHFYFSVVGTVVFTFVSSVRHLRGRLYAPFLIIVAFLLITFLLSLLVSRHFYDLSYDGQASHQEAILQLSNGWNPVYKQLEKYEANNMHRWLNHYTKGTWIYESLLFKVSRDIESAKLFQIWLIVASFFYTLSFLLRFQRFPGWLALALSLLVSFNPVAIYQSLSFYLDGQMMSLLVMMVVALAYIYRSGRSYDYFILLLILPILINTKLTAGGYAVIFFLGFFILLWLKRDLSKLRRTFLAGAIAAVIGFFVIGVNPFITNTVQKGNPFYPVFGPDHAALYEDMNMAGNYIGKNSLVLLFYSIFSKSDNVRYRDSRAELKIPFTLKEGELKAFTDTNAKEGGFGPLFGGSIVISFVIITGGLIHLAQEGRKRKSARLGKGEYEGEVEKDSVMTFRIGCLSLATILGSCLINPVNSLARFVPQMWLFPIGASLLAFSFTSKWMKTAGLSLLIVLFLNNLLIGVTYLRYNMEVTRIYNERFTAWAVLSKESPLKIHFGHFKSSGKLRFEKFSIQFETVEDRDDCTGGARVLPNSILLRCP
jgi:hypothetical protein